MDLNKFGADLDKKIIEADNAAYEDGRLLNPKKIEIKVVGQVSLLADTYLGSEIELEATSDFDAYIKASTEIERILFELLKEYGFVYDTLSPEIWMPSDTQWESCFEGDFVKVLKASAIDVLTSKAIKAKEKNRKLITKALDIYGVEFAMKIMANGGSLEYFKNP